MKIDYGSFERSLVADSLVVKFMCADCSSLYETRSKSLDVTEMKPSISKDHRELRSLMVTAIEGQERPSQKRLDRVFSKPENWHARIGSCKNAGVGSILTLTSGTGRVKNNALPRSPLSELRRQG